MLPGISLRPSFLAEIPCTLRRFFAGSLTILFVNTQAFLTTHLFLCSVSFVLLHFCHTQSCRSFVVCHVTTDPVTFESRYVTMLWRHIVRRLYSADFIPSRETSFQGQNKVCLVVPRIDQALKEQGAFATHQHVANGRAGGKLQEEKKRRRKTVGIVKFCYLLGFRLKAVARYLGFL